MLLIIGLDPFVQQWVQAHQEQHVDDQQWNDPNHNDDHDLNDGRISVFVLALTARTELLFFAFDLVADAGQDYSVTVAFVGRNVVDDEYAILEYYSKGNFSNRF
jgi:hypothetical protein